METNQEKNKTKGLKLYSQKAIGIATFLGGPLAAGYLVRENYLELNKPDEAKNALIYGLLATVVVFGFIFMLPDNIADKIPNQIIPIIYTAIIYALVENTQGKILKLHKELGNEFISVWKAVLIGFISLLLLISVIFGYAFLFGNEKNLLEYDAKMEVFSKNETETLEFYNYIDFENQEKLINRLDNEVIPKWNENIQIIKQANAIEGLPNEVVEQNKVLLKYSELRLQAFKLFKKAISENTAFYDDDLDKIHIQIDQELEKLSQ
jgi:hypothetical protein